MSARYQQLLAEWRAAAAVTKDAQDRLKGRFDAFLAGDGPEPTEEEVQQVHRLREVESGKLDEAMRYLRETTTPTRKGKSDHPR
jgi:hypothetical protein